MALKKDYADLVNILREEIEIFLTVAHSENMSRASEKLAVNQPMISKAIKRLETQTGKTLFHRSRDGVKLTAHGEMFYKVIESLKKTWTEAWGETNKLNQLKIGCHQALAMQFLPIALPKLKKSFPEMEIDWEFHPSTVVTRKVLGRELDLGVVITPLKSSQLIFKKIAKDFVAKWRSPKNQQPAHLTLIHPDMYSIERFKKQEQEIVQIPDYEVIAEALRLNPELEGILPASIAQRYQLSLTDKKLFDVDISCIVLEDRFDRKMIANLFDSFI